MHFVKSKDKGITTIIVICAMAIISALSMGLFLTAAVLMQTSLQSSASEQCRILAVSLSEQLEDEITDERFIFTSSDEEADDRAANIYRTPLWHYIKQSIDAGIWPYYEEGAQGIHSADQSHRNFSMEDTNTAGEISDTEITIYWLADEDGETPEYLVIETEVTYRGQSCMVTDTYLLHTETIDDYEAWTWEHESKY